MKASGKLLKAVRVRKTSKIDAQEPGPKAQRIQQRALRRRLPALRSSILGKDLSALELEDGQLEWEASLQT